MSIYPPQPKFRATVPDNFRELMIEYWMRDEGMDYDEALACYGDGSFEELCERLSGVESEFVCEVGSEPNDWDGICFEVTDNNFVIPLNILNIE